MGGKGGADSNCVVVVGVEEGGGCGKSYSCGFALCRGPLDSSVAKRFGGLVVKWLGIATDSF